MAPSKQQSQSQHHDFEKDEKCLCFHGQYLYEAKILDKEHEDPKDKKSPFRYRVHYKGWKNTWDDWVNGDRLRKLNDENKEFAKSLFADLRQKQREEREAKEAASRKSIAGGPGQKKKNLGGSELGSLRGSEERSSSAQAQVHARGTKRGREWDTIEKEETFSNRPSVRIPLPDHLKGLLVDDWENVTKQLQLVPLPHPHPVSAILAAYTAAEAPKRRPGSADADILEEVVQGVREYFDKCLGRILLYRFERQQWLEVHEKMAHEPVPGRPAPPSVPVAVDPDHPLDVDPEQDEGADAVDDGADLAGRAPSDVYGAEHLCRLFVSMPELIAQTNMDAQSVGRLREELAKLTQWLARNSGTYFTKVYMDPGQEYAERVKGTGL